jgi:hypothetical protein
MLATIDHKTVYANLTKCSHEKKKFVDGREVLIKCRCLAIKSLPYCINHIKLYPDIYKPFVESQSIIIEGENKDVVIAKPSKYSFINKSFARSYDEFYKHEGLIDLKNEIALMSATLNKLYAKKIDADSEDSLPELNAKIKIINQIRMLIKTMRELDEGKKTTISFNDLKIFMLNIGQVIKNHISDSVIQKSIAEEVFKLYNTNKDIVDANIVSDKL